MSAVARLLVLLVALLFAMVACGDDTVATPPVTPAPESDATAPATTAGTNAAADTSTTTPAGGDDELCELLAEIKREAAEQGEVFDAVVSDAVDEAAAGGEDVDEEAVLAGMRDAMDEAQAGLGELEQLYERAAAVAPPDAADDLVTVQEASLVILDALADALDETSDIDELSTVPQDLFTDPALRETIGAGAAAGDAIDTFAESTCGFRLSDS